MYDGISEAVIYELEVLRGEINELSDRVTELERKLAVRDGKASGAKRKQQSIGRQS